MRLELLRERSFDVVLCDLALPRVDGLTVFRHVRRESPGTAVIVTATCPTIADAIVALKEGATDFIVKPVDVSALLQGAVGRVAERRALRSAFEEARAWLVGRIIGAALIGDSPHMRRLLERLDGVATSDSAVLITGESGTGKDVVARTLYARSRRAARPFVAIDCTRGAAVESELFSEGGQIAAARGGTLFFDEVAEMPERVQARVAHALQGLQGIGARVLAATHHDLRSRVAEGRFREDLYFLLNTVDLARPSAARRGRGPARSSCTTSSSASRRPVSSLRESPPRPGAPSRRMTFPATCASSPARSSTRWRSRTAARSIASTSRRSSRAASSMARAKRSPPSQSRAVTSSATTCAAPWRSATATSIARPGCSASRRTRSRGSSAVG